MQAHYINYQLQFKLAAGTSRGVLHYKPSSFLILEENGFRGIGECSIIPDLSIDNMDVYNSKLDEVCLLSNSETAIENINLTGFPSIAFGLETALLDLKTGGKRLLFDTDFTRGKTGIPINGLVWMGDKDFMFKQIKEKIEQGYRCIKLKIGSIDFETELSLLRFIRNEFSATEMGIRVDANGAFSVQNAMDKLNQLSRLQIHSIEQPIRQNQWPAMAELCKNTPVPIVLDEELIGQDVNNAGDILEQIQPQYIILKPSLIGGFKNSEVWINAAESRKIGWWATSALESNIGLNAIAQWVSTFDLKMPQGLGTGQLYHNNVPSPLNIRQAALWYEKNGVWGNLETVLSNN